MWLKLFHNLKKKFKHRHLVEDDVKRWQQFQEWYTSPLGQRLGQCEKKILDKYLPDLFGYYLLQCGCPEILLEKQAGNWLQGSRVSAKFCLDLHLNQGLSCQSWFANLPMRSDSIDLVVLPHVLEFSSEPHQILRETERVLIAEGHVVILGFNSWSIWNIFRLFIFWKKKSPWNATFLPAYRVMDWLALLGFDVVKRQGYFYQPPFQRKNIAEKTGFLEDIGHRLWPNLGAGYILIAKKRVQTLTPIRPRWRTSRRVVATQTHNS